MDPLAFRQESPPTRSGRRAIGGLVTKAGLPRGGISGRFQPASDSPHEGPTPLVGPKGTSSPIVSPAGEAVTSRLMPPTAKAPESPKIVQPGPTTRPGARITPATSVVGSTPRTPEEHRALQAAAQPKPAPSKPQAQYGKPMAQAAGQKTGQAVLPGVAVHQQAMRGGAGTQLELPGGAAMHTPAGKEPKPAKPETIGQVEARRQKTFGSPTTSQREALQQQRGSELAAAASAKPVGAEGNQLAIPGMGAHSRQVQKQAADQLAAYQSLQEGKPARSGEQASFGSLITKEQAPATAAGKIGQTMRSGTPEERRAAIKQSAAGMRQRAEVSGRQQPREAAQPQFNPAGKGTDHHNNLADYHAQMAAHHAYRHKQTGDENDLAAAVAHQTAAGSNRGVSSLKPDARGQEHIAGAYERSKKAEQLSQAAGVSGGLSQQVARVQGGERLASMFGHDRPLVVGDDGGPPPPSRGTARGREAAPGANGGAGGSSQQFTGGAGSRGGRTRGLAGRAPTTGTTRSSPGVAGPNLSGNYWAGAALAHPSQPPLSLLGGRVVGAVQSVASARRRPSQQAQAARTAELQRQQQIDLLSRSMTESTPPVRSGTRRIG